VIAALLVAVLVGAAWACWRHGLPRALAEWIGPAKSPLEQARLAYERGDWRLAADLGRQLVKAKPGDLEAQRVYARALARLQRDEPASKIYGTRLKAERMEPEDYLLMGLALVRTGEPDLALEVWEKGSKAGPDHPELLDHLTRLSIRMLRLDEAAVGAKRLERVRGWEARGSLLLGDIQSLLDEPAAAIETIERGLKHDSSAQRAPFGLDHYRKLLARSLLQLGRSQEALESILAIGAKASDREADWLASRAYLQLGRISDASAAWSRAGNYRADYPLLPEPSPFVGAARCTRCHVEIAKDHEQTRHARTFHHGAALSVLPLPDHPLVDPEDPKVTHAFARGQDGIKVTTRTGGDVSDVIIDYAFGLPERYVTMVGRDGAKKYRAIRLSHFQNPKESGWTRTFGDDANLPLAEKVLGEPIAVRDGVVRCLYCHVTQSRDFRDTPRASGTGPEAADAGIGCERCHGPGSNHIAAVEVDFPDRAIVNAGTAGAEWINRQCADCHIVGMRSEIEKAPEDPRFVRSTAVTFTFSRCYTESDGALSCVTCHNPHRNSERSPAFYEAKCLACHGSSQREGAPGPLAADKRAPSTSTAVRGLVCKVNPARDCLACHMPKVPVPSLRTMLTDHYIRVHREKTP
jgi:tetratricopeptide (TPR) repeat protein